MNRLRKGLSLLLSVLILMVGLPSGTITVSAQRSMDFLDGDGTAENPYQISTTTHLNNVRKYPDAHFQLIKDLEFIEADFSEGGEFYNNGQGWEPIGTKETPFTGVFNGCGYTIQGLFIHRALGETTYTGLFGYTTGTVRDVAMLDSNLTDISNRYHIGGIAGYNTGSILRCSFEGTLSGNGVDGYAGGIAGINEGDIRACHSGGEISAYSSTGTSDAYGGGIVGLNKRTVSACYNTASLKTILDTVGGIAGWNRNDATVNNCYNTGSVYAQTSSESARAGGIVGLNQSIISRCYNVGNVSQDPYTYAPHAGGIVGESIYGSTNNCYYLDTISTGGVSGSTIVKCTEEQLRQQSTFTGFDFDAIWTWDEIGAYAYPVLREPPAENTAEFLGGDGTAANPYLISDLTHLDNIRRYPDAHFHLIADLTFTEEDFAKDGLFYNDGQGWEPIGTDVYTAFTGIPGRGWPYHHGIADSNDRRYLFKGIRRPVRPEPGPDPKPPYARGQRVRLLSFGYLCRRHRRLQLWQRNHHWLHQQRQCRRLYR